MLRLRSFTLLAPLLVGACSFINAPAEIDTGSGTGGGGGTGGTTTGGGGSTSSGDLCGDGKITGSEKCDDDNTAAGDGCSDACAVEAGFTCTGEPSVCKNLCGNGKKDGSEECDDGNTISGDGCDENCTPTGCGNSIVTGTEKCDDGNAVDGDGCDTNCTSTGCGNGIITAGEQCDDGGVSDGDMTNGDQDPCSPVCKFKEFDIQASNTAGKDAQSPVTTVRRANINGADVPTFVVYWHSAEVNRIVGRSYLFNGTYAKDESTDDFADSSNPDPRGESVCTASTNRTLFFWNDSDEGKLYSRKTEANGMINLANASSIPQPKPRPSCAASPDPTNTFLVTTFGKVSAGPDTDVVVQNFSAIALETGMPIDIGNTTTPNDTATIALQTGYLVAWNPDPLTNAKITSQQLDATGKPMIGFVFTVTDAGDPGARDLTAASLGPQDQFVIGYTRDSAPDAGGATHREVAIRLHTSPGNSMAAFVPATDPLPQSEPRIIVNPMNRKFLVVWTSGPVNAENVYYRAFEPNGTPLGEPVVANDGTIGKQTAPTAVVEPKTGNVVMVWDNQATGKPHHITAKIFPALLN